MAGVEQIFPQVSAIAAEFSYLKMLGHVFVVEDAKDLAQIVRDVTRYGGAYRPEVRFWYHLSILSAHNMAGCVRVHPEAIRLEENREDGGQDDVQLEFQGRLRDMLRLPNPNPTPLLSSIDTAGPPWIWSTPLTLRPPSLIYRAILILLNGLFRIFSSSAAWSVSQALHQNTTAYWLLELITGITGGFAPPTPSAIHTIQAMAKQPTLDISSSFRPDGTAHLQDALSKSLKHDDHTTGLVDELQTILKTIPTESPVGSEDIYGMDTSIAFMGPDFMWMNGGPQGCGGGVSTVQATAEDKAQFKRAVAIVNEIVGKAA